MYYAFVSISTFFRDVKRTLYLLLPISNGYFINGIPVQLWNFAIKHIVIAEMTSAISPTAVYTYIELNNNNDVTL